MAIDRSGTYDETTNPPPSGTELLTQYGSFVDALMDTAVLRLTSVAGTDTITASAEPFSVPATGLVTGMKFTLVPENNNTGAATLNIDARGAESIVSGDGSTLNADELVDGTRYLLEFDGTNFVIIGSQGGTAGAAASRTTYDATAVWANNLPANTLVMVELWGGGGGGNSASTGGGGGGAEYAVAFYKAGDLPTSVTITVPSGGAIGAAGGDCTFGSLLTALGGDGGVNFIGGDGGGLGGGVGASESPGGDAGTIHAGGAGGGSAGNAGGDAAYGGAGGGGNNAAGGTSKYGGNGGAGGSAGQRPGGGGGRAAAGGAGRCIITIF